MKNKSNAETQKKLDNIIEQVWKGRHTPQQAKKLLEEYAYNRNIHSLVCDEKITEDYAEAEKALMQLGENPFTEIIYSILEDWKCRLSQNKEKVNNDVLNKITESIYGFNSATEAYQNFLEGLKYYRDKIATPVQQDKAIREEELESIIQKIHKEYYGEQTLCEGGEQCDLCDVLRKILPKEILRLKEDVEKEIKIGEIFKVDGKMYSITNPKTPCDEVNEHGQIVVTLHKI